MKKYINKMAPRPFVLFLLVLLSFATGCVGSFGALQPNPGLLGQYQERNLPGDYTYYYCGRSTMPYAVVGIDKTLGFNDRVWFKIESKQDIYQKIAGLSQLHQDSGILYHSDILDTTGKKIGIWFSHYSYTPVRVDPETRWVEIFNPYNPNEDDGGKFLNFNIGE